MRNTKDSVLDNRAVAVDKLRTSQWHHWSFLLLLLSSTLLYLSSTLLLLASCLLLLILCFLLLNLCLFSQERVLLLHPSQFLTSSLGNLGMNTANECQYHDDRSKAGQIIILCYFNFQHDAFSITLCKDTTIINNYQETGLLSHTNQADNPSLSAF